MSAILPTVMSMRTRDGVRLDADVYSPDGPGPFPVLLMRQPYGRRIASTVTYAHPSWYAARGYLVVIQDVRGRGTSEGEFEPFIHERDDGEDTLEWVSQLPGGNGCVGMYGFSYQGTTQLFAAASRHPALKVMAPAMCAFHLDRDWAYEGGALRLYNTLSWAAQLGAESARRRGDADGFSACYGIGHAPSPVQLIDPAAPALRETLADTFYGDWLDQAPGGDYWRQRSPGTMLDDVDIPALHVGGWYDSFLTGTLSAYRHFQKGRQPQRLLVGPWGHLPWIPQVGQRWLGDSACSPVDDLQLRWFDFFLKGENNGVTAEPPISLYDLGESDWKDFSAWPCRQAEKWYLASNGRAGIDPHGGLLRARPDVGEPVEDVWVHDPWRPVPTQGGHLPPSPGIQERTALDARPDVLTYTTAALTETLALTGEVRVVLSCAADVDSFDLCAVLGVVDPEGRSHNLTQGYARVAGGVVTVSLRAVCATVAAGQCLRLSISGASYPGYALNDGSGRVQGDIRCSDYPIMTLRLDVSESWLELPVVSATDNG
ncbi:Hydrolase CocE/NonD family protein [Alloalcanivorax dieselolei B5]|uniref:Hydrolase CocE/NonD family protein n=1 Tax=Alcanivorax dieselolei (strain DSM 16502 / CGMCC 1.3690 / MCCC 1A00001 / B-5) TaxID=930169 RepID=K0CHS8_ALCDB|nr:CocE/NonD family hydrolase [Alloalcanivorax dieselolei]AFT72163.1 Hydrolase CocE/NonD family protein [Alloalcanivorax dieselolei B5]GGJ75693.1 putative peptidase [Alloalcanivorax dieselolei]